MTVEEVRREARKLGYNLIPIKRKERLLPCTCGCNRRNHEWLYTPSTGEEFAVLECCKCGKRAIGKSDIDVNHQWNEMIKAETK